MRDVSIIGAGPVGCYMAYLLADKFNVTVYEKEEYIGKYSRCTGIVTNKIYSILNIPDELITATIDSYTIKVKSELNIKLTKPDIVLNRRLFDKHLFTMALKKGVQFKFNHKLTDIYRGNLVFDKQDNITYDILIGADGPQSVVTTCLGLKNDNHLGIQFLTKSKPKDTSNINVSLNHGFFTWEVPSSEGWLVGCMTDKRECQFNVNKENVKEIRSGLIPKFKWFKHSPKRDIYLIGDAGGFVKETTGGGIVQGLMSAKCLSDKLLNNKRHSYKVFGLKLELLTHKFIRRILNNMSLKSRENLLLTMKKERNKMILQNVERDNLCKQIVKLFLKNPMLILYGFRVFI